MARQIHCVMKEAKNLDHLAAVFMPDPKHDEMAPLALLASDVKRAEPLGDFVAFSRPRDARASSQGFQCGREGFGIGARLCFAELGQRPAQDFPKVGLRTCRQAHSPALPRPAHFDRTRETLPATASSAIVARCRLSVAGDSKL